MSNLLPPFLKEGDTILIIGTARARSEAAIKPAIEFLQSRGLKVETGRNLYAVHHQFAGDDAARTEDLTWAVHHRDAKAALVAGGGYGTLRIIDAVDLSPLATKPKWFIGYSDTTVIHSRLLREGVASLHGPLAFQLLQDAGSAELLMQCLFGTIPAYTIPGHLCNRTGEARAMVVGGNLSLLYALAGSRDEVDTRNKILFIEDIDEQLYHIDRMMLQLKRSGKLAGLAGLVVGGMTDMKDNAVPYGSTAEQIIRDAVKEYDFPVCFDFPAGHIKNNSPLILGAEARLVVGTNKVQLEYVL